MTREKLESMIERYEMHSSVADAMKTKEYTKTREFFILSQKSEPCTNHWIVLTSASGDGSILHFGCLACGFREEWRSQD